MTDSRTPAQTGMLDTSGLRRILGVLCLTEITSWGILYYAFPVLSVSISEDTGWSLPALTAAFSLGQLAAAVVGIPVGRVLDHTGPRTVMTVGSVIAVAALGVIATAESLPMFCTGCVAAGAAMGAVLYPPAFAALTRWYGDRRVKALMILTLAGGLASTIFAPLTAALVQRFDWRTSYLVLAVLLAVITIPAHFWGLRGRWPRPPLPADGSGVDHRVASRSLAFVALLVALSLGAFTTAAAVFNLVPLLVEQGFSPSLAALTLGVGGVGQLLGRVGYLPLAARTTARGRAVGILAATVIATALLGVVNTVVALISVAVGAGLIRGVLTLIQATAVTDRWGTSHYGRLNGLISAPIVILMALAPWVGTVLSSWTGSYAHAYLILAAIAVPAVVAATASIPRPSTSPIGEPVHDRL